MQFVNSTFYFLRCGAKNSIANNEAGSDHKGHVLSPLLWTVEPHDQCGSDIDFIKFKYDTKYFYLPLASCKICCRQNSLGE